MRLYQSHLNTANTDTRFVYDGLEAIMERNEANVVQRRFVFGPGVDEPLVWYEGSGTTDRRWLHSDERGSVIAVSDSTGAATQINRYDEFGIPQAGNAGRFQYTGQAWFSELLAYNYKARMYEPRLGRFLQPDPIGYWDSPNLYAYVLNDPVNLRDPWGLSVGDDIVVVGKYLVHPQNPTIGWAGALEYWASHSRERSDGGDGTSPEDQSKECTSAPLSDILSNRSVEKQIERAIRQSVNTPNLGLGAERPQYGSEFAFNVLQFGPITFVGGTYTDFRAHSVRYRPSLLSVFATSITLIHTHQSGLGVPGLSRADRSLSANLGVNVVAVEPDGDKYCIPAQ